jgi:hypothetical protein
MNQLNQNFECCICLNHINDVRFTCSCCKSGFICYNCIIEVDPKFSPCIKDYSELIKCLKCPICRTINWNYHYRNIISDMFESIANTFNKPVYRIIFPDMDDDY